MGRDAFLSFLRIIWLCILALAPILPLLLPGLQQTPLLRALLTPSWLLWVFKLLYDNWDRFYFNVSRLWLYISNQTVSWTFSAEFKIEAPDTSMLDDISKAIKQSYQDAVLWESNPLSRVINVPSLGFVIRLELALIPENLEEERVYLYLEVNDIFVPFRQSEKTLNALINLIETKVITRVDEAASKYVLKVRFQGSNPYFGLFIRRLRTPMRQLIHFQIEFTQKLDDARELVSVRKDRLTLTARSLTRISTLSRRYITLASMATIE